MSEKNTIKLGSIEIKIDADFYANLGKYMGELEAEKNKCDPDTTKYAFATNLVETTKSKILDLIESRMHRIITDALTQVGKRNKKPPTMAMTPEEQKLYDDVLVIISGYVRDRHLQVFGEGKGGKGAQKTLIQAPTPVETPVQKQVQMSHETPRQATKSKDIKEYITIRMLQNLPTFVGADNRNYTLSREDVVMVPAVNAKVLMSRKAAIQINIECKK